MIDATGHGSPASINTSTAERWLSRTGVLAIARLLHAAFFVTVAAYCFLSYSPFAYAQFIKPNVVPSLTEFVVVSHWYYWAVLLTTVLTLLPQLRCARSRRLTGAYLIASATVGVAALFKPPLQTVGTDWHAFALGIASLVPPIWLARVDHLAYPAPEVRSTNTSRVFGVCIGTAIAVCMIYALAAPLRASRTVGIDLNGRDLAAAIGSALLLDVCCFLALFLGLAVLIGVARLAPTSRGLSEYWLFVGLLGAFAGLTVYVLVCASIAFTGWDAAAASAAIAVALAAVWADVSRLRASVPRVDDRPSRVRREPPIDSLRLFSAPLAGVRSRPPALVVLLALPVVAYELADSVSHFDWNFLLQKLSVLLVFLAAFAAVSAVFDRPREITAPPVNRSARASVQIAAALLLLLVFYQGSAALASGRASDYYAVLDPSFRLIHDARTTRSAETADFYAFLRSHTFLRPADVPALDLDFVKPLTAVRGQPPDIFLIVVDSLRRDYLSPYNATVTFTPEIDRLARESVVFSRAFTRYSGTALAVPSIWAGSVLPHAIDQPAFGRRNTLLKLLEANRYSRVMDVDHVIGNLVPADDNLVQLDKGQTTMQFDVCTSLNELERTLAASDGARPAFFYSLPQNAHISIASSRQVPEGESYPGFFAPVASSVRRIDSCLGGFVDYLKRTNRYDRSIIVLTSDHGDSLGEEGRWGHGHFIVPEVMRIPLIVHVPPRLHDRVSVDLSAVTFSSDITPSLYALLGYRCADLGTLVGRPAFVDPQDDSTWRRNEPFLLASSYGTAYAILQRNGTRMYVVDAVDGRDSAFEMDDDGVGERVDVTQTMIAESRRLIREQLLRLAQQNHYRPES